MIFRGAKRVGFYLVLLCLFVFFAFFGKISVDGASKGIKLCVEVLIPSIFPFMVLASILVSSGLLELVSRPANGFCRFFFKLPGSAAGVFILGVISGFPSGAKAAALMYENHQCTKNEAERLAAFCNNAGMGFVMNSAGVLMFQSQQAGMVLFLAQLFSAIISGYIVSLHAAPSSGALKSRALKQEPVTQIIVDSVASSAGTMVSVCGFVIFFSVCSSLLFYVLPTPSIPLAGGLIAGMMEVTGGLRLISQSNSMLALPLSGLILGWAGLSVFFQVASVLKKSGLSSREYLKAKLIQGPVCLLLTTAFYLPFKDDIVTCMASGGVFGFSAYSYLPVAVCILLLIVVAFFKKCCHFLKKYVKMY